MGIVERPSPNHDARDAPVDILLLHYTGMKTAEEALARLCDAEARVSAHYTIDTDGTVYAHVPEARRAWHAGVSYWAGERNVNARSIGIEIVNPGHEFGYVPFAEPQIAALIDLAQGILSRHPIPPGRVIGHSDVAPARKQDPGELFPWPQLAEFGIGLWPFETEGFASPSWGGRRNEQSELRRGGGTLSTSAPHPARGARRPPREGEVDFDALVRESIESNLHRIGYGLAPEVDVPLKSVVTAFQRHWRPSNVDGIVDDETAYRLGALAAALS